VRRVHPPPVKSCQRINPRSKESKMRTTSPLRVQTQLYATGIEKPTIFGVGTTHAKYNGRQMFNVWGDVVIVILDRLVSFESRRKIHSTRHPKSNAFLCRASNCLIRRMRASKCNIFLVQSDRASQRTLRSKVFLVSDATSRYRFKLSHASFSGSKGWNVAF
jgi:hypothetical protein